MKYILFTKTNWIEAPRIRHQIANLILEHSVSDVVFFQKPKFIGLSRVVEYSDNERLHLERLEELVHHKLRLFPFLSWLNSLAVRRSISRNCNIEKNDVIINFNYDYYFLKKAFPGNKIVTIINDDFTSRAIFGYKRPLERALVATCLMSDEIFAVSKHLKNQIESLVDREVKLLYPWADKDYKYIARENRGKKVLFWGYVNKRIDFKKVETLLKKLSSTEYTIEFVGPVERTAINEIERLKQYENFSYNEPSRLDQLDISHYCAALIPYVSGDPTVEAVECSNKSFQLLARGLPLLISGMPNFMKGEFVFNISENSIVDTLDTLFLDYSTIQSSIEDFLQFNYASTRAKQFLN